MKKTKLICVLAGLVLALSLTGCPKPIGGDDSIDNTGSTGNDKAINNKLVANFANAKYIAATKSGSSSTSRTARAATNELSNLVAIDSKGKITEGFKLSDDFLAKVKPETAALEPVYEVVSCDTGDDANLGTYIIFEDNKSNAKAFVTTDGEKFELSQVLFVNKEGKIFEVMKYADGSLPSSVNLDLKKKSADEYLRFDNTGKIYLLGKNWLKNQFAVFRWDPENGLKEYLLDKAITSISNYAITADGSYVFVNAHSDASVVYAINTQKATVEELYHAPEGVYGVNSITVAPSDILYFYSDCTSVLRNKDGGMFVLRKDGAEYNMDDLERYGAPHYWMLNNYIRDTLGVSEEAYLTVDEIKQDFKDSDYTDLLDFLRSYVFYDGDKKDIDFSLDYFAKFVGQPASTMTSYGETWTRDLSPLYSHDENGVALKNEAALKYLLETASTHANSNAGEKFRRGESLFFNEFYDYSAFSEDAYEYEWKVPLVNLLVKKGKNETAFEEWQINYLKSDVANLDKGIIIPTTDGIWLYTDVDTKETDADGKEIWKREYAQLRHIIDKQGNFINKNFEGDLENIKFYPRYDSEQHGGAYPDRKLPYAVNKNGLAAIDKDKKTIWYQTENSTVDLLKTYSGNTITEIVSFSMDETTVVANATISGGAYAVISIDLATKAVETLSVNKKLESIARR